MPEIVRHLAHGAEFVEIGRCQPAQRKPLQLPAKDDQQRHAQYKARDGIADENHDCGRQIEARAGPHSLGHAKGHSHQIADEKRPQPQADGDRQFFLDQRPDAFVLKKAGAQIEARELTQHLHKAFYRRLVKAVQRLDLFKPLGVHALAAPVAHGSTFGAVSGTGLGLGQILLHRATGHELDDHKGQQQHAQQRGNHQQNTFENIGKHLRSTLVFSRGGDGHSSGPPQARPAPSGGSDPCNGGAWGPLYLGRRAGPPQARPAPSGGSDPCNGGAWGSPYLAHQA